MQFVFNNITAKPGETVEAILSIKNNIGLSAFQGSLSIEGGIGYGEKAYSADFDGSWTISESTNFIQFLSVDGHNIEAKDGEFAIIDIIVPENTPAGTYKIVLEDIEVSYYTGDGQIVLPADKFEGVAATITVVDGETTTTTPVDPPETTVTTTTQAPVTTVTTVTTTGQPSVTDVTTTTQAPVTTVTTVTTTGQPSVTDVTTTTQAPVTTVTTVTTTDKPVTPPESVYGDVDNNGVVNAMDLMKLKQYLLLIVGKEEVPNGDLNKDGKINAVDMVRLVQLLLED